MIEHFKNMLSNFLVMCERPVGNTITLSRIEGRFLDEIIELLSNFITEKEDYYLIKYMGNTIKIEK